MMRVKEQYILMKWNVLEVNLSYLIVTTAQLVCIIVDTKMMPELNVQVKCCFRLITSVIPRY